jgi:hypothetical protein
LGGDVALSSKYLPQPGFLFEILRLLQMMEHNLIVGFNIDIFQLLQEPNRYFFLLVRLQKMLQNAANSREGHFHIHQPF